MDIQTIIQGLIEAGNAYDTTGFLSKFQEDAVLDDPSVGRIFKGHAGIQKYFEDYFIGYKTQTRIVKMEIIDESSAYLEVEFTGEFPEGQIGGTFDFKFKEGKIEFAQADLL